MKSIRIVPLFLATLTIVAGALGGASRAHAYTKPKTPAEARAQVQRWLSTIDANRRTIELRIAKAAALADELERSGASARGVKVLRTAVQSHVPVLRDAKKHGQQLRAQWARTTAKYDAILKETRRLKSLRGRLSRSEHQRRARVLLARFKQLEQEMRTVLTNIVRLRNRSNASVAKLGKGIAAMQAILHASRTNS